MNEDPADLTLLLERHRAGDAGAMDAVWPIVYGELKRIAQRQISGERPMTLTPTDLLHEACIKLFGSDIPIASRRHLFALAARVMRNVLVDHARARNAVKRGEGRERQPLDEILATFESRQLDVIALRDAIAELERIDAQAASIVELRFFGGLSIEETARALQSSTATVERGWRVARMWLREKLRA